MRLKEIVGVGLAIIVACLAGGCSRRETIHITITEDHGTNVMVVTTNGYTVMMGEFKLGTNFATNASGPPFSR